MSKARKSWIFQNGLSFQKFYAPEMQKPPFADGVNSLSTTPGATGKVRLLWGICISRHCYMCWPRPERHGVLCNMGMSQKEITFDLSQEALRQHYPRKETGRDPQFFKRAYKDIQRFMETNGFERRQYSVYVSTEELTALDVAVLTQRMAEELPWLRYCVREITATNIGARHSLLGLLRSDTPPAELLPPPVAKGRQKKRKVPER